MYKVEHPSGYFVTKFITVVVKPTEVGDCELQCFMVSDMGQALERDGVLGESDNRSELCLRKPNKHELLPTVYMESKEATTFDPAFFIVNVILHFKDS